MCAIKMNVYQRERGYFVYGMCVVLGRYRVKVMNKGEAHHRHFKHSAAAHFHRDNICYCRWDASVAKQQDGVLEKKKKGSKAMKQCSMGLRRIGNQSIFSFRPSQTFFFKSHFSFFFFFLFTYQ